MGTKMIYFMRKINLLALLFLINTALFAQNKETVKLLKRLALSVCLSDNYNAADSTFIDRDVSGAYYYQIIKASDSAFLGTMKFTREWTKDFYKVHPYGTYDIDKANQVFDFCMDFYESKRLDQFIKKALKDENKRYLEWLEEAE